MWLFPLDSLRNQLKGRFAPILLYGEKVINLFLSQHNTGKLNTSKPNEVKTQPPAKMNTPPSSINVPSATQQPHPQQYQRQAPPRTGSFSTPEEAGQQLLSMINDVLPLVDRDPELLSVMQDVTRLVCDYE